MATFTIRHGVVYGDTTIQRDKTYTGTLVSILDAETVADSQTDQLATITIDVSAVKAFFLTSDQALTVETNDGTTPADTITLVADRPYVWDTDSYDTFQLGTDVTALYFTNSSGSTATVYCYAVIDPSP